MGMYGGAGGPVPATIRAAVIGCDNIGSRWDEAGRGNAVLTHAGAWHRLGLLAAFADPDSARLKAAGLVFEREPIMQTWLWYEAWLRDPAGNALCLYHAGGNRTHPPWRLES